MNKLNYYQNYDIAIIGAGPAGCTAAYELGKEFKVILIEKGKIPPYKPCGGLLCEESIEILKKWKMPKDVLSSPPYLRLSYMDLDNNLTIKTEREFWNINRKRFSNWLIDRLPPDVTVVSRAMVTDIQTGEKDIQIATNTSNSIIGCKYLIGADGISSITRRKIVPEKPRQGVLNQVLVGTSNKLGETSFFVYDEKITPGFYSWIIPKEEGVLFGTKFEKTQNNLKLLMEKKLKELAINGTTKKMEAHPITLIQDVNEDIVYGSDHILLIGEAAGFVSPTTGEGISYALHSGLLASRAIKIGSDKLVDLYREICSPMVQRLSLQLDKSKTVFDSKLRKNYLEGLKND